uniref:Alpha-amylase family protein n=1 Tax=Prevotella sp. GTC17262 TaxID=3236797 RepID=A0AB33JGU9_9BACT
MNQKIFIYQVLPRLFGNRNVTRKENGTIAENGCGKFSSFDDTTLAKIRAMGFTHVWYTGVIRHATTTDYSSYGIPRQHPAIVKGKAGSPYAITDYYDVDPDLAEHVDVRMDEWENLIARTHAAGMKVIMDFVPNHVARQYHSVCKPEGVRDLGEDDNAGMGFSVHNNFYYCVGQSFEPSIDLLAGEECAYYEYPAKATGNDRFDAHPGSSDWYETIKLNYGIDYCDAGGRSYHFDPIPNTWQKMTDILLFWASKGVDGFRCDMAEMVPSAFWSYATKIVKERYQHLIFIGEVYDTNQYRQYVGSGFDYLYDKVGMYDCVRDVICGHRPAASITYQWQCNDDIFSHMLYFLENHDEQRVASDFFCGDGYKAIPGLLVCALLQRNPFMVYSGQEFGEYGMDKEGFSGIDGRTTIFDYWSPRSLVEKCELPVRQQAEKELAQCYRQILTMANREKIFYSGLFYDLMSANPASDCFDPRTQYAFLRKADDEVALVVVNFSQNSAVSNVVIPNHAFDFFTMPEKLVSAVDLLSGDTVDVELRRDGVFPVTLPPYGGKVFKFNVNMDNDYILNEHGKDEFPPAHSTEHLLNQVMVRRFHCGRSINAHIERKKSKMTFKLDQKPSRQDEKEIEREMNRLIAENLPVTYELVDRRDISDDMMLERLPDSAGNVVRLVRIGDFDVCPCVGKHVRSTSQIGRFELLGTNWDEMEHSFRIRFKVVQ